MCGIAAVLVPRGEEHWLDAVLRPIEHRGSAGTLYEKAACPQSPWSMGTHRLPIVAPSTNRQPARSPSGRYHLVLNGEVFNYRDLAHASRMGGADRGDTHTLAACVEAWGVRETVTRLDWEGALLCFDARTRLLWAARDHLGIKPLYRARFARGHAYASEIKALVTLPGCGPVTPVAPGSVEASDSRGSVRDVVTWWSPDRRPPGNAQAHLRTPQHLLALLRAAVHARVPPDGAYAITLSGGLDSSLVLRLALETGRMPTAYVLHRPGSDDLPAARRLCRELSVPLKCVLGDPPEQLLADLPDTIAAVESWEWQVVNHAAPMRALTRAIAADGHRVALSGEGADELFLGYRRASDVPPEVEQRRRLAALHMTNCRRLDRVGMRSNVEFRVPFLDRAVTEWALGLPPAMLIHDGVEKRVLRKAAEPLLPGYIVRRPKQSMATGAGYRYSPAGVPTVFGKSLELCEALPADHPLSALARYPSERIFLKHFTELRYEKAHYLMEHHD